MMKNILALVIVMWFSALRVEAGTAMDYRGIDYTKADSLKVVPLLSKANRELSTGKLVIYFARQLRNLPYVAKTLERNKRERLVINLRQLDCTTYVENVIALVMCAKAKMTRFQDFCQTLQAIRYHNGTVDYVTRKHYFTDWIDANSENGYVTEISEPTPPFSAIQQLQLDYMSTHVDFYPMLKNRADRVSRIKIIEKSLSNRVCRYIPKSEIKNTKLLRKVIHDGDIIAIVTNKKGLDTSHLGIAIWHADGLHMLNASQVRKKVVEEPMTLRQYMGQHPSQLGIRIVRVHHHLYKKADTDRN